MSLGLVGSRSEAGRKLVENGSKIGRKLAENWLGKLVKKLVEELVENEFRIGWKLDKSWSKIGSNSY